MMYEINGRIFYFFWSRTRDLFDMAFIVVTPAPTIFIRFQAEGVKKLQKWEEPHETLS